MLYYYLILLSFRLANRNAINKNYNICLLNDVHMQSFIIRCIILHLFSVLYTIVAFIANMYGTTYYST